MAKITKKETLTLLDRETRLDLLQRILGLKHKLKVHDSVRPPETHEDIAIQTISRWELEDEIKALEEILEIDRRAHIAIKRENLEAAMAEALAKGEPSPLKKKKKY